MLLRNLVQNLFISPPVLLLDVLSRDLIFSLKANILAGFLKGLLTFVFRSVPLLHSV